MAYKQINQLTVVFFILIYISTLAFFSDWQLSIVIIGVFSLVITFLLPKVRINILFIFLMLFFSWCLITSINSHLSLEAFRLSLILGVSSIFIFWIATSNVFTDRSLNLIFKAFVILQTFNSLYGIIVRSFGKIVMYNEEIVYQLSFLFLKFNGHVNGNINNLRLASLFENPNTFALYSLLAIVFGYFLYLNCSISLKKYCIIFVLNSLSIYFAFSRTVIVVFLLFLFIVLLINLSKMNYKKLIIGITTSIIIIILFLFNANSIFSYIMNSRFSQDINGRDAAWMILLEYIENNILFGSGFGQVYALVLSNDLDFGAHNIYLLILAETGIIGFLLFLSIILSSFILIILKIKENSADMNKYIMLLIFLTIIIIHQFFETQLMRVSLVHYIWILLMGIIVKSK